MGIGNAKFVVPPPDEALRLVPAAAASAADKDGADSSAAATLPARTSVLVWNMQKEQNAQWAAAFAQLARGRDLLVLQELHLRADDGATEAALRQHGHSFALATSFYYASDGSPTGSALGATVRPISVECQVTNEREPVVGTPKSAAIAEYAVTCAGAGAAAKASGGAGGAGGGAGAGAASSAGDVGSAPVAAGGVGDGRLLVASVHGINRAPVEAFEAQIDALRARMARHTGPLLLAGDFNTQSARKLAYLETAAAALGLSPVVFSPDTRTVSKLSRRPLDHAFVRGARVVDAACHDAAELRGSDHVAMSFDLVFDDADAGRTCE